ncbi:hypothetical protein Dimus_030534 [Dionaea muscipula]
MHGLRPPCLAWYGARWSGCFMRSLARRRNRFVVVCSADTRSVLGLPGLIAELDLNMGRRSSARWLVDLM